jgi:hypothetical protein
MGNTPQLLTCAVAVLTLSLYAAAVGLYTRRAHARLRAARRADATLRLLDASQQRDAHLFTAGPCRHDTDHAVLAEAVRVVDAAYHHAIQEGGHP